MAERFVIIPLGYPRIAEAQIGEIVLDRETGHVWTRNAAGAATSATQSVWDQIQDMKQGSAPFVYTVPSGYAGEWITAAGTNVANCAVTLNGVLHDADDPSEIELNPADIAQFRFPASYLTPSEGSVVKLWTKTSIGAGAPLSVTPAEQDRIIALSKLATIQALRDSPEELITVATAGQTTFTMTRANADNWISVTLNDVMIDNYQFDVVGANLIWMGEVALSPTDELAVKYLA